MNIKKLLESNPMILSPMAGVTDFAFRSIASEYGADITVTEMVSAKALCYNNDKTIDLLHTHISEKTKAVQLFGNDADTLAKAAQHPSLQMYDIIDYNCGCPAPKIVRNGDGCAMMRDIDKARECITALVNATDKPVSVKFRLGIDGNNNYIEFGKMCQECGVAFVTLHGRSREQFYSGICDYNAITELVNALDIPVIANGDISDRDSYITSLSTGAAGVSIGRASMGKPWIFNSLKNISPPDTYDIIMLHYNRLKEHFINERELVNVFKKHLAWYTTGMIGGAALRKDILTSNTMYDIEKNINKLKK